MVSVAERLDTLRAEIPGCSLVAFGDMRANVILRSSQDRAVPREQLDELCRVATNHFTGPKAQAVSKHLTQGADGDLEVAIVLTVDDTRIFVTTPGHDADMLCCVCDGQVDAGQAVESARAGLKDILGTL